MQMHSNVYGMDDFAATSRHGIVLRSASVKCLLIHFDFFLIAEFIAKSLAAAS